MMAILVAKAASLLLAVIGAVRRFALLVVISFAFLTAAGGYFAVTHIKIRTDTNGMLSPDLPFQRLSRELSQAFPKPGETLAVVVDGQTPDLADDAALALAAELRKHPDLFPVVQDIEGDPFFRANGLLFEDVEKLEALSDRLAKAQPFLASLWRDPSLRGLFNLLSMALEAESKGLADSKDGVEPVLGVLADVAEAQAKGEFKAMSWRNLMTGAQPWKTGRRFIVAALNPDSGSLSSGGAEMKKIRELAGELGLTPDKGVRVRLTGSAALANEELKSVAEGMGWANVVSLLLVLGLLVFGLRNLRLVLCVLATLLAGLVLSTAYATVAVGRLNLISVAFAVLFIGIGVDFGIHFALRFREALARGDDKAGALAWAAGTVGGPLFLCAATAAIGFFSFMPTDYLGLAELGHIAGVSMFVALICNLTLLPALLTLWPPLSVSNDGNAASMKGLRLNRPKLVVGLGAALALVGVGFLPWVRFDFDPLRLKDPKSESVSTLFDIAEKPRSGPYGVSILAADLAEADKIAKQLRALPEVAEASSISDYVPGDQEAKLDVISSMTMFLTPLFTGDRAEPPADDERRKLVLSFADQLELSQTPAAKRLAAALRRLPNAPQARAEFERRTVGGALARLQDLKRSLNAAPFGLADLPKELRADEIVADGRVKVKAYPKGDMKDQKALAAFVAAVRSVAPNAAGGPVTIYEASIAVLGAFKQATITTVCALLLLMAVLLRNLREVALVFAPLLLAALLLLPVSVLADLPFNFANVIVLPLLFGLGVANGIQFVFREKLEKDTAKVLATTTPRAVIFSALTTMVSFGSLAVSSHPGTANMGVLLAIALSLVLIATLFFLPALMQAWKRKA